MPGQYCKSIDSLGGRRACLDRHWHGLNTFLDNGRVEMDSNRVENRNRPVAPTKQNALFASHDEGGSARGRIASLIEIA
ncbi:MAG: transposase [bacterium]|nr:transposase [bacterium]